MLVEWTLPKACLAKPQARQFLIYVSISDPKTQLRSSGYFFSLLRSWDENKNFSRLRGDVLVSILPRFLAENLAAFHQKNNRNNCHPQASWKPRARSRRNVIAAMSSWGEMFIWDLLIFSYAAGCNSAKKFKNNSKLWVYSRNIAKS